MRNRDVNCRTVTTDSVNLLHRGDDIVEMFDHVIRMHFDEVLIGQGPRAMVEIVHQVGMGIGNDIDVECVGAFLVA